MIKKTSRQKWRNEVRRWALDKKEEIYNNFDNKCHICKLPHHLTIHHLEYKKEIKCVQVLCSKCHREYHNKELLKKLLLFILEDLKRYDDNTKIMEYKRDLQKRAESIEVNVLLDLKELDGLPF